MAIQPRGFGLNGKSIYENVAKPSVINAQWTVTPTNGLGVTSLKSNGYIRNVFMRTSTTPSANEGYTNPNPANGFALVQFNNNFNYYLNGLAQFIVPTATSTKIDNSALTAGQAYVISVVGDATLAKWLSIGLPPGITPAVGVSFIATAVGTGSNVLTSRVELPSSSGIVGVEVVGNPNTMLSSSTIATNGGAWMLMQFMGVSIAGSTPTLTMAPYTPAGTVAAPVFTGDALATHTHTIPAGTDAGGGVSGATSGGTPTGTNSAPAFTGTQATLTGTISALSLTDTLSVTAPATGTVICVSFKYDASSVTIDGL